MAHRPQFDIRKPLVAAKGFIFAGEAFKKGDPFPVKDFSPRLIKRQYEAHAIDHVVEAEAQPDPVQMTGPQGGRYTITAPWLDEPEVIRGKALADARFAELKEAGAPLGWIEGGSAVTVEGGEGGWYDVTAPWLDEADRVQGREAAELRQRELHDAGEPDLHHGVSLTAGENGYYSVKAAWLDDAETVHGQDAARERAAQLREEGPPADADEGGEGEGDDAGTDDETDQDEAGAGDGTEETATDADQGAQGGSEGAEQGEAGEGADAGAVAGDDANKTDDAADPHKGAAEQIPGTGPAKAADDVAAAAGKAPKAKRGAGKPASE